MIFLDESKTARYLYIRAREDGFSVERE